jgi:hypothetical protein
MKPGDFLLGVLDFFAILLPGSLATWLVAQYIPPAELRRALSFGFAEFETSPDSFLLGGALLLSSYVLGHFVHMTGAQLDTAYDRWRRQAKPTTSDVNFKAADAVRKTLTPMLTGGEFSTLKWSKAYIQTESPEARVEIDRLEADSKFFRSLVIVALAFAAHFLLRVQSPAAGVVALALARVSFHRFRDQRWKLTELSYATAVIVHAAAAAKDKT